MFLKFNLFDLFYLSFIQLVLSTVLVLSPARAIGTRFRWTGSRITEVFVGGVGAAAISALAVVGTHELWGMAIGGLETAAYLLVVVSVVVMVLQPGTNFIGQVFFASFLSAFATSIVYAAFIAIVATHSIAEILTASLVILLDLAALVVWISNINYTSDVLCRARRGRPLPQADPSYQPFVSLHVPAYNEPPELLIETIKAVERIDYPNFEVIVIDNNTADPAVWGPVEEYCRDRPRVKFVHVAPWPGYKAGACNLALRRYTDPRAEIIGLVDADDIVQPYYLREVAPYFSDPDLGFIQTFEGNREFQGSAYYTACVDSFQAFYLSVMSSRNERDSIPFVGTMGLFRRSALTAVGGWNEWCICEDTEASLRVARDGWSGLYIPRCFGRGVVPPSFAGMLTQRHRWCFGGMQIMRLHWRSLMPWDRSVGNHLTSAQRRDYLMASIGWFRDLLMLAFSLLLIAVSGLLVTDSGYAISPMDGARSQLPMSLIVIATICMLWTLRLWTTMSFRRALLSLVISLSVTWVVALGCIEGMIRKDAVFLRTSKVAGRRRIGPALRLTRFETILAAILYTGVGLLAASRHRPWLLMSIIFLQACVYLCGPIASVWNLWAQGVTSGEYRRRFEQRRLRAQRRRWSWGQLHRPVAGAIAALAVGGVASAFLAPVPLLQATAAVHRNASAPSLLGGTASTEVYLKLGSSTSGTGGKYYPITAVHLLTTAGHTGLKFSTSSLALLGEVLQASAAGGKIPAVTLAFRAPGLKGQLTTEAVDTFGATTVTAVKEHLSPMPAAGSVSLTLPAQSHVLAAPAALQRVGPFGPPTTAAATDAVVTMGAHGSSASYAVSAVQLAQTASGAPLDLKFSTSSVPLLDTIFHDEGTGATINDLTLTIRAGGGGQPFDKALTYTFAQLSVGAFAENLSGSLSGTAALVVHPR